MELEGRDDALEAKGKSITAFTWLTMFTNHSDIEFYSPMPHLFVDVFHENEWIATAHVNEFYLSPIANISMNVAMDKDLSSGQIASTQELVYRFLHQQNYTIQLAGAGRAGRELPSLQTFPSPVFSDIKVQHNEIRTTSGLTGKPLVNGGAGCFLQDVVDVMPPIHVRISPPPLCENPEVNPQSSTTDRTVVRENKAGRQPSSVPSPPGGSHEPSQKIPNTPGCQPWVFNKFEEVKMVAPENAASPLELSLIEVHDMIRSDSSPFWASAYAEVTLAFPFEFYGFLPDLYIDVYAFDDLLGYLKVYGTQFAPGTYQVGANVEWISLDEKRLVDTIFKTKGGINAMGIHFRGRPGNNKLSDLLFGMDQFLEFPEEEGVAIFDELYRIILDETNERLAVNFTIAARALPSFTIRAPPVTFDVANNRNSVFSLVFDHLDLTASNSSKWYPVVSMLMPKETADYLGRSIDNYVNDKPIDLMIKGSSLGVQTTSQKPIAADIQVSFLPEVFKEKAEPQRNTRKQEEEKRMYQMGFEVNKLERSSTKFAMELTANLEWNFPVSITGTFPDLNMDVVLDAGYSDGLVSKSTDIMYVQLKSFEIIGNKVSTPLNVEISNQTLVTRLALAPDAANITIHGNSGTNIFSRIVSNLNFPFAIPRKSLWRERAKAAVGAVKKSVESETNTLGIKVETPPEFFQTSFYINIGNLDISAIPIDLKMPDVRITFMYKDLQKQAPGDVLLPMATWQINAIQFSKVLGTKHSLGYMRTRSEEAKLLGMFINDFINDEKVGFGIKATSQTNNLNVDVDMELKLGDLLELIDDPDEASKAEEEPGWIFAARLNCQSRAKDRQWSWEEANDQDQWLVICPSFCDDGNPKSGAVYGAHNRFAWHSSVCKAAWGQNLLSECGGKVVVTVESPSTYFPSKVLRPIDPRSGLPSKDNVTTDEWKSDRFYADQIPAFPVHESIKALSVNKTWHITRPATALRESGILAKSEKSFRRGDGSGIWHVEVHSVSFVGSQSSCRDVTFYSVNGAGTATELMKIQYVDNTVPLVFSIPKRSSKFIGQLAIGFSCVGTVAIQFEVLELVPTFSLDKFESNRMWPLSRVEPIDFVRGPNHLYVRAGLVLKSLGVSLSGVYPSFGAKILIDTEDNTKVLLSCASDEFKLQNASLRKAELGINVNCSSDEERLLVHKLSTLQSEGMTVTVVGSGQDDILSNIIKQISYKIHIPKRDVDANDEPPQFADHVDTTNWPTFVVDVVSNDTYAGVFVGARFTPDFNAGFDIQLGRTQMDIFAQELNLYSKERTKIGYLDLQPFNLVDNACTDLNFTMAFTTPEHDSYYLTAMMRDWFHGFPINASIGGHVETSAAFEGNGRLAVYGMVDQIVNKKPPQETNNRCLCEEVWTYNEHVFYGECVKSSEHPSGFCKIRRDTCIGTPAAEDWDHCTRDVTRTVNGCKCKQDWSYQGRRYSGGTCANPNNRPVEWCEIEPGSCLEGAEPEGEDWDDCVNRRLAEASEGVKINSVHILGSEKDNHIVVPCVLPGTLCPYDPSTIRSSGFHMALNISLVHLPFPVQVNFSTQVFMSIKCCGLTEITTVQINSVDFSSDNDDSMLLDMVILPVNLPLIQETVQDILDSRNDVVLRFGGGKGENVNLLSYMFSDIDQQVRIFKSDLADDGSFEHPGFYFDYWLEETTSKSATFITNTTIDNPMPFTWDLGKVDVKVKYQLQDQPNGEAVVVATSSFPFELKYGNNSILMPVTVLGEPELKACMGYPRRLPRMDFCAANELLSRIIASKTDHGIPIVIDITTVNWLGSTVTIQIPMTLFSEDTSKRRNSQLLESSLTILERTSFKIVNSITDSLRAFSLKLSANFFMHNPFNVPATLTWLSMKLYMKDWEGGHLEGPAAVILGGDDYPPVESLFMLEKAHPTANPEDSDLSIFIGPNQTQKVTLQGIKVQGMSRELAARMYSNFVNKNRLCLHLYEGEVYFKLQAPKSPEALVLSQFFDVSDIDAIGGSCQGPPACDISDEQYIIDDYSEKWYDHFHTDNAVLDGEKLRVADSSLHHSTAFGERKVRLADSWVASFEIKSKFSNWHSTQTKDGISFILHNKAQGKEFIANAPFSLMDDQPGSIGILFMNYRTKLIKEDTRIRIVRNGRFSTDDDLYVDPMRPNTPYEDWTQITIKYNYDTKFMYVYYKDQLYMVGELDVKDIGVVDEEGKGWVGFGASNGGGGDYFVRNFSWKHYKAVQTLTRIHGGDGNLKLCACRWISFLHCSALFYDGHVSNSTDIFYPTSSGLVTGVAGRGACAFELDTRNKCDFAVYYAMGNVPCIETSGVFTNPGAYFDDQF